MIETNQDRAGQVTRGDLDALRTDLVNDLKLGRIPVALTRAEQPNIAGGQSFFPNSDISYSTLAATVPGTLPADVDDLNYEAFGLYWAERGADVVLDAAHALKSLDHTLYAAEEGTNTGEPDWDRVNGWVEAGAEGATQYDIIVVLPLGLVGAGQRWFFRFRTGALDATPLPADVQAFAGFWHETASGQGYVEGGAFDLSYVIRGTPGATSINYRVLAKTDGKVSILSNVLNVPDAPAALNSTDYVKLFFNPGSGFIEFAVYKEDGGTYYHLYTIRNSSDLQYNDTGVVAFDEEVVSGWPSATGTAPQAYAESRNLLVGSFAGTWKPNDLTIQVPPTYDQTQTTKLYLRFGLTAATGVDRHVGLDRFVLAPTYHEWAPDPPIKFADGTIAIPSISPTSGSQGAGGGVGGPPDPGGGGPTCIVTNLPVLTVGARGRKTFKRYQSTEIGSRVVGEEELPYVVLDKRQGFVSEYYLIKTANGVTVRCSVDHPFALSVKPRKRIPARDVKEGTLLAGKTRGKNVFTKVVSVKLIPTPTPVGTYVLRHAGGLHPDGDGMYVAGESAESDRGLYCFNRKVIDESI